MVCDEMAGFAGLGDDLCLWSLAQIEYGILLSEQSDLEIGDAP